MILSFDELMQLISTRANDIGEYSVLKEGWIISLDKRLF
jgi:hypothetical protein